MLEATAWFVSWVLPAVPLAYLIVFRRDAGSSCWIIALAFLVSWFAEVLTAQTGRSWVVSYLLPPMQFGLFAHAFGVVWPLYGLSVIAIVQVFFTDLSGPDLVLNVTGCFAVLYVSRGRTFEWTMFIYCGLGTLFYLLMVQEMWQPFFIPLWYAYQACRTIAVGTFVYTVMEKHA